MQERERARKVIYKKINDLKMQFGSGKRLDESPCASGELASACTSRRENAPSDTCAVRSKWEKLVRLGVTHGPKSLQRGRSLTVNCRRALDHKVSRFHGVDDVGRAGCHDEPAARVGGGADDLPH